MNGTETSGVHFLNVSYFFRIIYETVFGGGSGGVHTSLNGFLQWLSEFWVFVTIIAILIALGALWVLIYTTMRIYQIRIQEAPQYATISEAEEHELIEHSRWAYIRQLIESPNEANWRQAIIEADIMLDEMLTRLGYVGDTTADKLKAVSPAHFATLNNAW